MSSSKYNCHLIMPAMPKSIRPVVGKIFRIGEQPMNAQVQAFSNIEKPEFGADWTLRFQLQFLFPK